MYLEKFSEFLSLNGIVADEYSDIGHLYAFTICPTYILQNGHPCDAGDLRYAVASLLNILNNKGVRLLRKPVFELTLKNRGSLLHLHGIMATKYSIYMKTLFAKLKLLTGFSVDVTRLDKSSDYKKWSSYILKTEKYTNQDQILAEHQCLHYNLFQ